MSQDAVGGTALFEDLFLDGAVGHYAESGVEGSTQSNMPPGIIRFRPAMEFTGKQT